MARDAGRSQPGPKFNAPSRHLARVPVEKHWKSFVMMVSNKGLPEFEANALPTELSMVARLLILNYSNLKACEMFTIVLLTFVILFKQNTSNTCTSTRLLLP